MRLSGGFEAAVLGGALHWISTGFSWRRRGATGFAWDGQGRRGSQAGTAVAAHGEREAERLVAVGLRELGLCDGEGRLLPARKGDPRKVALATLVRARTAQGNDWIATRLEMGHNRSVSRLIRQGCLPHHPSLAQAAALTPARLAAQTAEVA